MKRIRPDQIEHLRALAAEGKTVDVIAAELGSTSHLVRTAADIHGIAIRRMTPSERGRVARAAASSALGHGRMSVPAWVPADLRTDYRDHAASMGPAWAERMVRSLIEAAR